MSHIDLKKDMLIQAKRLKFIMKVYHETGDVAKKFMVAEGICSNIMRKITDYNIRNGVCCILDGYFESWDEFSGNHAYPIPPKDYLTCGNYEYYHKCVNKYEGRQYKMRMKLIKHIIKCLKRDIKNEQ